MSPATARSPASRRAAQAAARTGSKATTKVATKTPAKAAATGTPKAAAKPARPLAQPLLLVATRKGAWLFHGDARRRQWRVDGPHFHGHVVSHLVLDPRDGRTLLAAVKTGHLGPTIFRSTDFGRRWKEAAKPPAFANAASELPSRAVDQNFWLTPGHASQPGSWYVGTSPQGLFRSEDGGDTWAPIASVNDSAVFRPWMGTQQDGTPDGPKLHSVIVDPRDPAHLMFGMSGGGVHESFDAGESWHTLIQGLEVVEGFDAAEVSFHDPHCIRQCPSNPDRLYQQNHCGIYRMDRGGGAPAADRWERIGRKMPKRVGDAGFPMLVHPHDADTAWVFPMDAQTVWPRTSPGGKPAAYVTRNGGRSWQRLDKGLPAEQAWWTVKRQAMAVENRARPALYLGTTSGELWVGHDEGERWALVARHLPEIYAIEAVERG